MIPLKKKAINPLIRSGLEPESSCSPLCCRLVCYSTAGLIGFALISPVDLPDLHLIQDQAKNTLFSKLLPTDSFRNV